MLLRCVALAATVSSAATSLAAGPILKVGLPAPSLAGVRWVKGSASASPPRRKVRVVEFWATWCAPCRDNVPHLTSLAQRYAGRVEIVGLSVWEEKRAALPTRDSLPLVRTFVARQGSRMAYTVGADRLDGAIAKRWLDASGSRFIPTAFVVDDRGRIAWIGNARSLDDVLPTVLAHAGDPAKAVALAKSRRESALARLEAAAAKGDVKTVLSIKKGLPDSVSMDSAYKLLDRSRPQAARAFAEALMRDPAVGMWQFLDLAWCVLGANDANRTPSDYRFAVRLVQTAQTRADPSDESRLACLDYLITAYAKAGDAPGAARAQALALEIMEGEKSRDYTAEIQSARKRLEALRAGRTS